MKVSISFPLLTQKQNMYYWPGRELSGSEVCEIGGGPNVKRDGRNTISGAIKKNDFNIHNFNFWKIKAYKIKSFAFIKNRIHVTKLYASNKHTQFQSNIFIFSCAVTQKHKLWWWHNFFGTVLQHFYLSCVKESVIFGNWEKTW